MNERYNSRAIIIAVLMTVLSVALMSYGWGFFSGVAAALTDELEDDVDEK